MNESGYTPTTTSPPNNITEAEEARQTIEILRGVDDVAARIAAAHKLTNVAKALGEQRTRDELIPFLTDGVDEEDEVLAAIADELGKLVPLVGGVEFAHTLLSPLEILLSVEELSVRDNAIQSASKISTLPLIPSSFYQQYFDMISRLAEKEWYTARVSATALISMTFDRFTPTEQEIQLENFVKLCRDETPMVRRVAAQYLGKLLQSIIGGTKSSSTTTGGKASNSATVARLHGPNNLLSTTFVPLYEELAGKEQPDSVRLHTAENCIAFGDAMASLLKQKGGKDELSIAVHDLSVKRVLPLILATIDDRSWRVRWTAASKFGDVIHAFSSLDGAVDALVPAYERLLQDPEAEVRTAATLNLAKVGSCKVLVRAPSQRNLSIGSTSENSETKSNNTQRIAIAKRLVKKVATLTEDESENVRAALAMVATDLAPVLGKDATISELVPPVLLLLRDSTSEVRLNIISSLSSLNEVVGVDILSQSLLGAIVELAEDGKWRIRLAIMQQIPTLAKQLGKVFFSEKLTSLCVNWLLDNISSIRQAATSNLKELAKIFGGQWVIKQLIPPLEDIRRHRSYLRRMVAVQSLVNLATVIEPELSRTELLPLVLEMATDNVANIRFNVAKGLEILAPLCGRATCNAQIRPILSLLVEDQDRDVRFYANKTLQTIPYDV